MELVTEPVIHTAEEAAKFAKELQLLLTYLGISHANMEKGELRLEANISVSKNAKMGTKVEVKNLNSFRSVERAIRFEFDRQISVLEVGGTVAQETRGWNEEKGETYTQRSKEDSHDYRYFPDPDLPKLFIKDIPEFSADVLETSLPELPWEKRERYQKDFGLKDTDIEIYVRDSEWGSLFEEVALILKDEGRVRLASNYMTSDLKSPVAAGALAEVVTMLSAGEISSRGAKDILKVIESEGGEPRVIAEKNNLMQKSEAGELNTVAEKIIAENAEAVEEYKKGKLSSLQFLIGQAMKEMKGSGNPVVLKKVFEELLG